MNPSHNRRAAHGGSRNGGARCVVRLHSRESLSVEGESHNMGRVSTAVSIVKVSHNGKLGRMSATYAAQTTCPDTCAFRNSGCYAEGGALRFSTNQRNDSAAGMSAIDIAWLERDGIIALATGKGPHLPLRVHVVGDSVGESAAIVGGAMVTYESLTGQPAYTYTHGFRETPRGLWGAARVLASCESEADARDAVSRGYHVALVVAEHASDRAYHVEGVGTVVPCPSQTRGKQCADCGLCYGKRAVHVAFAVHGTGAVAAKAKLG